MTLEGWLPRRHEARRVDCLDRQLTVGKIARGNFPDRARKASMFVVANAYSSTGVRRGHVKFGLGQGNGEKT